MNKACRLTITSALIISFMQPIPAHAISESSTNIWHKPTKGSIQLLSRFSLPHGSYNVGHRGIDIFSSDKALIFSPDNGIVHFVGTVVDREVITLALSNEFLVSFEPVTSELTIGDRVKRGQRIATLSTGGHCNFTCLHIGVRRDGVYQNPIKWFAHKPQLLPISRRE